MDTLLLIDCEDDRLCTFLRKMGYRLVLPEQEQSIPSLLIAQIVDCVLIDTRGSVEFIPFYHLLRSQDTSRTVPIVCLAVPKQKLEIMDLAADSRLELVEIPYSIGGVVSKIATQLRLRKMTGAEDSAASLAETNAALRDLNQHFARQLEEARSIQLALLPTTLPSDESFEIAVSYQPLEEVGGDWYFVRREPSGAVTGEVADVTGHGLPAAFVGSMTKLARTAAAQDQPHKLLTEMNRLMAPQIPEGRFVTMCAFRYEPTSGALSLSCAGHPAALVLKRNISEVVELGEKGFAIGFFGDSEFVAAEQVLEPGDVMICFSDGLTEARNRAQKFYGVNRVADVLKESTPQQSADDILKAILEDASRFRDGRILKDDFTLLVLRRIK